MSRDRAITTGRVFASVMGYPGAINPPPALEHPPRTGLEILLLYVGENGPRISDTGRIVRRSGDQRSNKAYASEKDEGDDADNEEAYAAKNIGQRYSPRFLMTLQGQRLKLHYDVWREWHATQAFIFRVRHGHTYFFPPPTIRSHHLSHIFRFSMLTWLSYLFQTNNYYSNS